MKTEPGKELDDLARAVIGAAIEVHRHLGPGFQESVYEEALCIELDLRGVPYARQQDVTVTYKGQTPRAVPRAPVVFVGLLGALASWR